MSLADDSYYHGSLLDGFLSIFDLKYSSLRRAVEPLATDQGHLKPGFHLQGNRIVVVIVPEHFEEIKVLLESRNRVETGVESRKRKEAIRQ
jgi:hypothetical protein